MTEVNDFDRDDLVLFLMPTNRDTQRTRELLRSAGLVSHACQSWEELCEQIKLGAGTALFTEELLEGRKEEKLAMALSSQPAWSDFPLVILAREGNSLRSKSFLQSVNSLLVERPIKKRSLLSVVHAALRARRHQYAVRQHLADHELQAKELIENETRLSFALAAGRLGSWDLDLTHRTLQSSASCRSIFGRLPSEEFSYQDLFETIHTEDRDRIRRAVEIAVNTLTDYDVEYRINWPDGSLHWVLVRGRVSTDQSGMPLRLSGVSLDITKQKQSEKDLQDADRRKDEFLAMLAHELRNPLAPVRTGLELLALSKVEPESIDLMRAQVDHLVHLVDDLLDVSRITRGKIQLRKEVVDLLAITQRAIDATRQLMVTHEHILIVSKPSSTMWLDADPVRLAQIITNLLNNAAKYTPNGGEISLTISQQNATATISVRDNGIGLDQEILPRVFDLFTQADQSLERSEGGLGIGLTLVKSLVEVHGGTVEARSAGTGSGSEFVVTLPLLTDYRPAAEVNILPVAVETRRILLVDDSIGTAFIQAKLLEKLGNHEVRTAHDGLSAIQIAIEMNPDIILLDIGLPKMNGFEVASRLRELPQFAETLLVALTGYGTDEDRRRSKEVGFDLHLVKPPSLASFRHVLNHNRTISSG